MKRVGLARRQTGRVGLARRQEEVKRVRVRRTSESQTSLKLTWLATRIAGRFSPRAGGWFAARLWFVPWAVDADERSRRRHARWLEGATPISIPHEGGLLAGFTAGEGPTVLLVHGWGERAATLGALVQPLVERGFRVVGIDLPAHGDTSGRRTNLIEEAAAVRSATSHLGGVHALLAHSMGGAVAALAVAEGAAVERVVLVASALRLDNALTVFTELFGIPERAVQGLRRYIERRFGATVWDDFGVDRLAPSMEIPALVIHDVDDPQIAFADGEVLAARWPGARFVATQGLGHVKILGDERVISEIGDFLERAPIFDTTEKVSVTA